MTQLKSDIAAVREALDGLHTTVMTTMHPQSDIFSALCTSFNALDQALSRIEAALSGCVIEDAAKWRDYMKRVEAECQKQIDKPEAKEYWS